MIVIFLKIYLFIELINSENHTCCKRLNIILSLAHFIFSCNVIAYINHHIKPCEFRLIIISPQVKVLILLIISTNNCWILKTRELFNCLITVTKIILSTKSGIYSCCIKTDWRYSCVSIALLKINISVTCKMVKRIKFNSSFN